MSKTVLFQTIQFSISTQFSSVLAIDRTLLGAITPGQSGPGSNNNKMVLYIRQVSRTSVSPSNEMQSPTQGKMPKSIPWL